MEDDPSSATLVSLGQSRRTITLIIRPLEAFEDVIRRAPALFDVAPAMVHHWALKLTDPSGGGPEMCFEIGIQDGRIMAQDGIPWNELKRHFKWIERRIGYTMLSDEQILHEAILVVQGMGSEYRLFSANCQIFSRSLFESIRVPIGWRDLADGLESVPKPVDVFLRRCQEAGIGAGSIVLSGIMLLIAVLSVLKALRWTYPRATSRCRTLLLLVFLEGFLSLVISVLHLFLSTLLYRVCSKQSVSGITKAGMAVSSSVLLVLGYASYIETLDLRIRSLALDDPCLACLVPAWFITLGMGFFSTYLFVMFLFCDESTDNVWVMFFWGCSTLACLAIYVNVEYGRSWDPAVYQISTEALDLRAAMGLVDYLWLFPYCLAFMLVGGFVSVSAFVVLHVGFRARFFDFMHDIRAQL